MLGFINDFFIYQLFGFWIYNVRNENGIVEFFFGFDLKLFKCLIFFYLLNDDYFNLILKKDKIMIMVVIRKFNIQI